MKVVAILALVVSVAMAAECLKGACLDDKTSLVQMKIAVEPGTERSGEKQDPDFDEDADVVGSEYSDIKKGDLEEQEEDNTDTKEEHTDNEDKGEATRRGHKNRKR